MGKTWLARYFAKTTGRQLVELNLEKNPQLVDFFVSNDPKQILLTLSAAYNQTITPTNSLLFIDEIQAAPILFSKLRWFAEDLPELPVIAAGSLLDFMLADHEFSMPVGRINYLHLEPLSFQEFLLAHDYSHLCDYLASYQLGLNLPNALHQQLMQIFKEYTIIGGLPAAVASWTKERSIIKINQIHHDLLATYRDDFSKYSGRVEIHKLDEVMMSIPHMLGQKFVYSRINPILSAHTVKHILNLLHKARIGYPVLSCAANGVPLRAEVNDKFFKEIFLDVGLAATVLGLSLDYIHNLSDLSLINNGALAEQAAGQLLRTLNPCYMQPELFYWQRHEKGSNAEVDYIIQHANQVIPIEIKAGSMGSLKSLHLLMQMKKLPLAIRVNSDLPSKVTVDVKDHMGNAIVYELISIPFYLVEQIHRLLAEATPL